MSTFCQLGSVCFKNCGYSNSHTQWFVSMITYFDCILISHIWKYFFAVYHLDITTSAIVSTLGGSWIRGASTSDVSKLGVPSWDAPISDEIFVGPGVAPGPMILRIFMIVF